MGFAAFPNFIVFRDKVHPMHDQWLNHEKIHHHQNWETLGLAALIGFGERMWARYALKKTNSEAYFFESIEQEAYANQANADYLKTRKLFAFTKYFRYKPVLGVDEKHQPLINF
jgi:hypothetical protein